MYKERTKDVAKARLLGVLREDRTHLSVRELALMQLDVLAALSGYVEMEREKAAVSVEKDAAGRAMLTFTVPVVSARRRRGNAS